ncbi:PROTEIN STRICTOSIDINE SYNTHASE-LIKE 10 [Salix viminalis]|uniref:PROTEIN STRICTOSIDINE SYNTHASE-LIKE 10 n=1 Tax=Salix viminalis TaxID=40686 RepID=A0A9Q0ZP64_SALVM|nr:PROTEIN STRICTOSIDINE SYNTHASE-LIKE 10 [Salix viminalis]
MPSKKLLSTAIPLLLSTLAIFIFSSETSNSEPLSNAKARKLEEVPIEGAFGPESFAFDSLGEGPYTSLSDGRIIKWQGSKKGWTDFAAASADRYACV